MTRETDDIGVGAGSSAGVAAWRMVSGTAVGGPVGTAVGVPGVGGNQPDHIEVPAVVAMPAVLVGNTNAPAMALAARANDFL